MSPEQAAGEREIDGRSDLYSLGIVAYQMLTGELPFNAPTVAGILMKQITEPAPDVRPRRPDVPEDLALAVSRCLEKDPENRWPTRRRAAPGAGEPDGGRLPADRHSAGKRAAVATRARTATARPPTGRAARRRTGAASRQPAVLDRDATSPARARPGRDRRALAARGARPARRRERRRDEAAIPDTGEPKIVQQVRGQFASWAAVSLGCFGINVATGIDTPWFLFPTFGMGIGVLRNYAQLWQAGYSWRDVLTRPPAPDAIETTLVKGTARLPRQLPPPTAEEFGAHLAARSARCRATGRPSSS